MFSIRLSLRAWVRMVFLDDDIALGCNDIISDQISEIFIQYKLYDRRINK